MPMQKIETVDRSPGSEALASGQTTLGELATTVREDYSSEVNLCFNWAASDSILINLS
jgi:hypothetical protein